MNDSKPRQCFYIPEEQYDDEGWIPSLVTEGRASHIPFLGNGPFASPWHWGTTLAEAQATAERENFGTFGLSRGEALAIVLSSIRADSGPEITHVRDAEIRVFDREPGTDDASDMYVIEVLGVTVRVRLVTAEDADEFGPSLIEPYITVEADGQFTVSVNEDENYYGDGC